MMTPVILLVEDEAIPRYDFAQQLRAQGFEVLEAKDGVEAITKLETYYPRIDLVITDMVMPKLNGLELITNIQARWPKLRVIMLSAYMSQHGGDSIIGTHALFLQKPVRPSALVAAVRSIVSQPLPS